MFFVLRINKLTKKEFNVDKEEEEEVNKQFEIGFKKESRLKCQN